MGKLPGQKKRMAERDSDLKNCHNVDLPAVDAPSSRKPGGRKPPTIPIVEVGRFDLSKIEWGWIRCKISGMTPEMNNKPIKATYDELRKKMLAQTEQGATRKPKREPRNPEQECLEHTHICKGAYDLAKVDTNLYGFPAVAIKKAVAQFCYDTGVTGNNRIIMMRYLFIHGPYAGLIPLMQPDGKPARYTMQEDIVYVYGPKGRKANLAWRPVFFPWEMTLEIRYLPYFMSVESLLKGLRYAGTFIGIGSWSNEHGGSHGAWTLDPDVTLLPADYQPKNYR